MDLDRRWIGDRIHYPAILLSHCCSNIPLSVELLLAWMRHGNRAVGDLLYSPCVKGFINKIEAISLSPLHRSLSWF